MEFNIEEVSKFELTGKTRKVLKLTRKKDKMLSVDDIKKISGIFEKKLGNDKFYIRVFGKGPKPFTVKETDGALNIDTIEDYFDGHVQNVGNFDDAFFQIHVGFFEKSKKEKNI
jgi:hypothetical protein